MFTFDKGIHTASSGGRRARAGRRLTVMIGAVGTVAALLGSPGLVGSASGHASASAAAGQPQVQRLCAPSAEPGVMTCFSVVRTDSLRKHIQPGALPQGYGPADLKSAYKLSNATAGDGKVVAIVDAFDDPNAESDLATYRSMYGLPPCTTANGCFTKVNQYGEQGNYPPYDSGWAGEISLDLDMVSAVCPKCHILLVEANDNYVSNLGPSVSTAVSLGATYVSNSYGAYEWSGETAYDTYYHHNGVAVTASTGDYGYGVAYPSTSPYVAAVGGTTLVTNGSARGWGETAWKGAGSGCSAFEAKPAWQNVSTGCPRRAVADVSAVADPNTGVAVYFTFPGGGGGWWIFGGTSVSSPVIASLYALAGTPGPGDTPASYPYAHPTNLYDVVKGSNGTCSPVQLCTAGKGWDGPTGLGTPHGSAAFKPGSGTWTGPVNLGMGPLASAPGVVVTPNGYQSVFWKGSDGKLVAAAWDGTTWTGPIALGKGPLGSQPTGGIDGSDHTYLFWKGTDGSLQRLWWNGSTWIGPRNLGMGKLSSAPAAAVGADGQQYVFWKGSDGKLVEAHWNLTRWIGPTKLGFGPMGSQPTVGIDASKHLYVFWKGTDGNLKEAYWTGAWHTKSLGMGPLGSAPAAAVTGGGQLYVFWKGTDGSLQQASWTGSWSGPTNLGMGPLGSVPTAGTDSLNRLFVYWKGGDGNLIQAYNLTTL